MGGKGGVGKTCVMTGLAEWFQENSIPVKLLDLDTENKSRGSLTHFFGGQVPKVNIHTPAGLDAFVDELTDGPPVILADMGAGAGQVTYDWFDKMYPSVAEAGITFTSVGVITADPASVESVLAWASRLTEVIRDRKKASGQLGEGVALTRHVSLNWTKAQKADPQNYRPGQVLRFHRAVKGISKNQAVEVVGVKDNAIAIHLQSSSIAHRSFQAGCSARGLTAPREKGAPT